VTLMAQESISEQPVGRAEIYYSVEQFYARQMHALDSGDAASWVATFTSDGVFTHLPATEADGAPSSVTGHDELLAAVKKSIAGLASAGVTRRHLVSTLTIDSSASGGVRTHCYVPVIDTRNGTTALHMSTVLQDILVFSTAGWLVQERTVSMDGLPSAVSTAGGAG
jgi:actinorhodin biosynthesis protein ActVIA